MDLNKTQIKTIAIFRALQLGDILCSIPALRNLRMNFPNAHIAFIGLKGSQVIIDRFADYFDEFISFPGYDGLPEQEFNPAVFDLFCAEMKVRNFDLILQMQGNGSIVNNMLLLFEPKQLAGFSRNQYDLQRNNLMMHYPNFGHESSRHLQLMSFLGLDVSEFEMEFPIFRQDEENFAKQKFPLEEKYICVHPGSRAAWRQWPTKLFAQIADLCVQNGFQVVITGTKEEFILAQKVADQMQQKALILAGKTDLGTLGVLLKNAAGVIANCTGISHIAAGLKVPSVIISMDGDPERWASTDEDLHFTIDWTKQPDFDLVKQHVMQLLLHQLVRSTAS